MTKTVKQRSGDTWEPAETIFGAKPVPTPYALSKVLENLRLEQQRIITELELLGDGHRAETRRLRDGLQRKLQRVRRQDFLLRQHCLQLGYATKPE